MVFCSHREQLVRSVRFVLVGWSGIGVSGYRGIGVSGYRGIRVLGLLMNAWWGPNALHSGVWPDGAEAPRWSGFRPWPASWSRPRVRLPAEGSSSGRSFGMRTSDRRRSFLRAWLRPGNPTLGQMLKYRISAECPSIKIPNKIFLYIHV